MPEIFLIGKSIDGKIRLGWTQKMKEIYLNNFNEMLQERIAIEIPMNIEEDIESFIVFNRDKRTYRRF